MQREGIHRIAPTFKEPSLSYLGIFFTFIQAKKKTNMNTRALKYEIIEWITKTDDNSLLKALKLIKDSNIAIDDWFEHLTKEEKESITRGISNHEQGEVLTSKAFWSDYEGKV